MTEVPITPEKLRELATKWSDQGWLETTIMVPLLRSSANEIDRLSTMMDAWQIDCAGHCARITDLDARLGKLRAFILDCFEQEYNERDEASPLEDLIKEAFVAISFERKRGRTAATTIKELERDMMQQTQRAERAEAERDQAIKNCHATLNDYDAIAQQSRAERDAAESRAQRLADAARELMDELRANKPAMMLLNPGILTSLEWNIEALQPGTGAGGECKSFSATHAAHCAINRYGGGPCDCGVDAGKEAENG